MTMRARGLRHGDGWERSGTGLYVPPALPTVRRKPIGVGLFAGAGGFDLGFTYTGFHMAAAVEFDRDAAATYLVNLGGPDTVVHRDGQAVENPDPGGKFGTGWISGRSRPCTGPTVLDRGGCTCAACVQPDPCEHLWLDDIRKVTGAEILDALGMQPGEVYVVIGGPPCQGFSIAGKRDVMDPRNSLVFEFARLIREIQPQTFVMENVTGIINMITPEGVPVLDALARQLSDADYGDYQALRRAMLQQAGAVAGTPYKPNRRPKDNDEPADTQEQMDLFGAGS